MVAANINILVEMLFDYRLNILVKEKMLRSGLTMQQSTTSAYKLNLSFLSAPLAAVLSVLFSAPLAGPIFLNLWLTYISKTGFQEHIFTKTGFHCKWK